ncbi:MAG: glycosyltransferase family 39 protein [Candidatus Hydrogenedentes bacterium]|nr:glycosyltransferase family 39 protein [Candidatus Hydrogenedentota bacterium]
MSGESRSIEEVRKNGLTLLMVFAAIKLVLHLILNSRYGYHRDELYFLACAEHMDFGYVDHSPLVPWIAFVARSLLGDSLPALRFIPALAGAGTVILTGLIARELGAGRFAQALAALSIIIAPVYLRAQNMLHIPTFEPLFWGGCAYLIIRIIKYERTRLWLWVGALAGVGLMNKPTMLFFGVGLAVGLVLRPARKYLLNKWLWAGGALAFLIFLPNLIWQATHGWATLAFAANLNKGTMSRISSVEFLFGQLLYLHPFNAPIWIAGLWYYLRAEAGRPYRVLGWVYVTVLVLLLVAKSKIYYLAPAYAWPGVGESGCGGCAHRRGTDLGASGTTHSAHREDQLVHHHLHLWRAQGRA